MSEYGFTLTRILPYKDRIYKSVLIRKKKGQCKPLFLHILCRVSKCEDEDPLILNLQGTGIKSGKFTG